MGRAAIEQYLYLMDAAFDAPGEHALLSNLQAIRESDWHAVADGGRRSIFDIVQHVGECKFMYANHAFGDRRMSWGDAPGPPTIDRDAAPARIEAWLREGQSLLRAHVSELSRDAQLLEPRAAPWGAPNETRWIINAMIQHDLYHAGEINHLRSVLQRSDRWAYEEE